MFSGGYAKNYGVSSAVFAESRARFRRIRFGEPPRTNFVLANCRLIVG